MLAAVEFDDEAELAAGEVGEILADTKLTYGLQAVCHAKRSSAWLRRHCPLCAVLLRRQFFACLDHAWLTPAG